MYSSTQSFTLACVTGETGDSYTASATASSIISQADAETKALTMARALAYEQIQCSFAATRDTPTYYNTEQTASVNNDAGYQVDTFTFTMAAGTVYSKVSQADANAGALAAAQYEAEEKKNREQIPIFYNASQSWSGACPGGTGNGYSIVITIPANTISSNVSTADANNAALDEAKAQVEALLVINCVPTYFNEPQTFTANCSNPLVGNPVTVTVPARAFSSLVSQADADDAALAAATASATAQLVCVAGYWNVEQTVTVTCEGTFSPYWEGADSTAIVAANLYFSEVSQEAADTAANGVATAQAIAGLSCVKWGP